MSAVTIASGRVRPAIRSRLARWACLAALAAAGPALAQAPGGAPPAVTAAKPVVKDVIEYTAFTGRFEATESVEIRARVGGYLDRIDFVDGTTVKAGDVLFTIDRRPFKAALDQAQATLTSQQARLNFAQTDNERADSLRRSGNIAEQLVDQRRQAFISAKADFDNAEAALRNAQLNYDFTEVKAPISGRIGRRLITPGNLVTADTTLLTTIVSLDPIFFYFDIDERNYISYQRTVQTDRQAGRTTGVQALVGVTDEEPRREARIDFLDNRVDLASGTIRARAVVPNTDLFLTPGLFGTVKVASSTPQRGVLIPDEAIGTDQDRRFVWMLDDAGTATQRVIQTGPMIDGYRLVRSGLSGTETIVTAGTQRIRPGAKVNAQVQTLPPQRS